MDWASIIGIGLQFLGQKKASDAAVGSATDYNAALIEAAKPKNVVGPAGGVVWDEATQTFVIAPSNPLMGLMGANLEDVYRQRSMIEGYMSDPEAAAQARFAKTQDAMQPYRERKGQGLLGQLIKSGTAGSTMGIAAVEEDELSNRLYDATRLEADRANVQGDITNYINRSNAAEDNYYKAAQSAQELANIGTGIGSSAYTAAAEGGKGLMNVQAQNAADSSLFPFNLGTDLLSYRRQEAEDNLAKQSMFSSRFDNPYA